MPIPTHREIAPYPQGHFKNGTFVGERLVECASSDVAALLAYFDAYPNNFWPAQYNFGGWAGDAVCIEATVSPKPKVKVTSSTSPLINYDTAWIKLTYSTDRMKYVGGRYLWETFEAGLQPTPIIRASGLRWSSDNTAIMPGQAAVHAMIPHGTLKVSQFKLAVSPPNLPSLWGCVNSGVYTTSMLGYTFAPGTLLYAGAHILRGSPGALVSDWKQAHHTLYFHPIGWNKVYHAERADGTDANTYETVLLPTGAAFMPQRAADLSFILT